MVKAWRHLDSRTLAETRVFTLNAHRRASQETGREGEFYVLHAPDWVNVIAVTPDDWLVLVRQYRHGVERVTLEIPGGMVDPTDASPEAAARRELVEETGFAGGDWKLIGVVDPNPATHANRCFTYLATGVEIVCPPAPDAHEELEVAALPVDRAWRLLADGAITHALVVAAFQWWALDAHRDDPRPRATSHE